MSDFALILMNSRLDPWFHLLYFTYSSVVDSRLASSLEIGFLNNDEYFLESGPLNLAGK